MFVTDILTPYTIAVMGELAELVDLGVIFAAHTSARSAGWTFGELPFAHRVVGGASLRRSDPDVSDYYLDPRVLTTLLRWRPAVVVSAGWSIPTWYAALYCRIAAATLIIHSDGTSFTERRASAVQRLSRRALVALADGFAANSRQAAERFHELGACPDAVHPAPHSTDLHPFWEAARQRADPGRGRLRVLMAGRLVARKGFAEALPAVARAQVENPGISLTIAGSGPDESRLR
ncbi:MAG: glycosyltransferase [Solirubrobacteraceae bacterium]